jgi:1-acyl-sn-glycerol-3-phosphate acyltransferase
MSALDTVAFLSKSLVRKIPFIGRSAYMGGTVFFSRSSADERQRALEETLRMCRESTAVVVFPEGTRSLDGGLREKIYPRSIKEAHRSGLKVIPVALHGTYKVFPKTMDRVETGLPVSVHIGDAIDPRDHASPDGFVEACWQTVADLHDRARREIEGEGCSAEGDAEVIGRIGKAGSFQRQAGVSRDVA